MPQNEIRDRLRSHAKEILEACLRAVDPEEAVKRFVRVQNDELTIGERFRINLSDFGRVLVVGAGKAGAPMGKALEALLGDRIDAGLICVKYGYGLPLNKIRVREAGHPVPDAAGVEAAQEIVGLLRSAGEKDLVICCISGGGSALLPGPVGEIKLENKQDLIRKLLAVGANIHEINAVRKHLSFTKGGNLMATAYPATVVNLMLSDVAGDDTDTIASGPFVPDKSTFHEAQEILNRYELTNSVAAEIIARLSAGVKGNIPETPKPEDKIFERAFNIIVGSNILSLQAGKAKAEELGYNSLILSSMIEGDAHEASLFHVAIAAEIRASGNPTAPPACVLSGGETTVVVRGGGLGGRNQEFALCLVRKASELPNTLFLSAGTDGSDGPTDAAGAIVDELSLKRGLSMGLDPEEFLRNNDSYHFFQKLGDLIVTGPTRTNVMDVRLILVRE